VEKSKSVSQFWYFKILKSRRKQKMMSMMVKDVLDHTKEKICTYIETTLLKI